MADELDLERGDPSRAEDRRSRRRPDSGDTKRAPSEDKLDKELHNRLVEALDQVVEWREAREDEELATAINEDKDKMAKGLVSLTHVVAPLRRPLTIFLGFVEPVLAFGRVGRILAGRVIMRRERIAEERAAMAEEMAAQPAENAYYPGQAVP